MFDLQKNTKIVFDFRLKNKDAEVVATYCISGACKISCPKAKKDFFDEISSESSDEIIKGFAGEDVEVAKYYPEDKDFLLEFEPMVVHYEVVGQSHSAHIDFPAKRAGQP